MKDLETVQDVLASARAGLAPTPVETARVRQQLVERAAAFGALGAATVAKSAAAGSAAVGTGASGTLSLVALTKLFAGSFVLTVAGSTAVVVGIESATPPAEVRAPVSVTAQPPSAARTQAGVALTHAQRPVRAVPERGARETIPEPPMPASTTNAGDARNMERAVPSVNRATHQTPPPAPVANDLDQELALLQEARAAAAAGRTQATLQLLAQLDRQHPVGVLREERSALHAMASCQGAVGSMRTQVGAQFLIAYPQSVYAGRVRLACGALTDPAATLTDRSPRGH